MITSNNLVKIDAIFVKTLKIKPRPRLQRISENMIDAISARIEKALAVESLKVEGSHGHYRIKVVSKDFVGKTMVQQQRLVYAAIADLMKGPDAPIHAIDFMETIEPSDS